MTKLGQESKAMPPRLGWVLYDGDAGSAFDGFTSGRRQLSNGVLLSRTCNPLGMTAA